MALITGWYPPTKEHYDTILLLWKFYPLVSAATPLTTSAQSH